MFCSACGANNEATAKFCHACGAPTGAAPVPPIAPGTFTLPPCKVLTETAPGSGLYQCS